MLIYNEERFVPTEVNMLVIRGRNNVGFFYIHRSLYDQAVILNDIYGEDIEMLIEAITGNTDTRDDVQFFLENAPTPINIFAPFLLLVKEPLTEFKDMIGAIHVMSGPMNFRKMLKIPFEMRNTPTFSLSIREEYVLAWDMFLQNVIPYSTELYMRDRNEVRPMNGVQTTTVEVEDGLSNVGDDGVEYADPLEALLFGAGDDIFDLDDEDEETDEEAVAPVTPVSRPEPAPIPTPVQVPEPTPEPEPEPVKTVSGIDALLGGL